MIYRPAPIAANKRQAMKSAIIKQVRECRTKDSFPNGIIVKILNESKRLAREKRIHYLEQVSEKKCKIK